MQNNNYEFNGRKKRLRTNRNPAITCFFTVISLRLYEMRLLSTIGKELNIVSHKNLPVTEINILSFILSTLFFNIGGIKLPDDIKNWIIELCDRVDDELARRNIDFDFSSADFVASELFQNFIYLNSLVKAMNLINEDYNKNG